MFLLSISKLLSKLLENLRKKIAIGELLDAEIGYLAVAINFHFVNAWTGLLIMDLFIVRVVEKRLLKLTKKKEKNKI